MGCKLFRDDVNDEEIEYCNIEKQITFSKFTAEYLDLLLHKYSCSGFLNDKQWGIIVEILKLGSGRYIPSVPIRQFYDSFKTEQGYVQKDLIVLAGIMGTGDSAIKSKLIYQAFDIFDSKTLNENMIVDMFDTIYNISVEKIHVLAVSLIREHMLLETLEIYIDKLRNRKEKLKEKFIRACLNEKKNIILDRFVEVFEDPHMSILLNSSGFRQALLADKSKKLKKFDNSVELEIEGGIEVYSSISESKNSKYGKISSDEEN